MEVVKRVKQNEVELRDRNTVLRGTKPNVGFVFVFFPASVAFILPRDADGLGI